MEDLKAFFIARVKGFDATLEDLDDDAAFLASKVADAVLKRDSNVYIRRILGKDEEGMFQRKAKPKAGMAMIEGMVKDMAPHMEDSPFKVDNKGDLIDSISTQFSKMEAAQSAPLSDLRTLLSESKTLSATKKTIAIRNAIINKL